MTTDTRTEIRSMMAEVFSIEADVLPENASPSNITAWDSYGHFDLMAAIEKNFDLQIPHEVIVNLLNEDAIVEHVDKLRVA
jgi:acyl carrier protein